MLVLPHVSRRLGASLTSFALAVALLLPAAGVASAATSSTRCPPSEGGVGCVMVISAPASVVTRTAFTVQVLVTTNGTTVARTDPCGSRAPITLNVYNDGGVSLTYAATASAGIASFSVTIPLNEDGVYWIYASARNGLGAAPATSAGCTSYYSWSASQTVTALTIPPTQPIVPCPPDTSCVQALSGSGSAATLIADAGAFSPYDSWAYYFTTLGASGIDIHNACALSPSDDNGVLGYTYDNYDPVTIVFALDPSLVTKGIGLYNVCWNSLFQWTQPSGRLAVDNGDGTFTGLLPNCRLGSSGPCVLFRRSSQHNGAFIGVLAPWNDPRGYVG